MKGLNITKWILGVLCFLGLVFPVADASAGRVLTRLEMRDWLTQDNCPDWYSDPAFGCSGSDAIGKTYYFRHDQHFGTGHEGRMSVVLKHFNSDTAAWEERVVSTFDWDRDGHQYGEFDQDIGDGGDFFEFQGEWASITGTKDGGTEGLAWIGTQDGHGCQMRDGWLRFKNDVDSSVRRLENFTNDGWTSIYDPQTGNCANGNARVYYKNIGNFTYASGKSLETILSCKVHGAMECQYFTREYGLTRFEAWTSDSPATCNDTSAVSTHFAGENLGGNIFCNGVRDASFFQRFDAEDPTYDIRAWSSASRNFGDINNHDRFMGLSSVRNGGFGNGLEDFEGSCSVYGAEDPRSYGQDGQDGKAVITGVGCWFYQDTDVRTKMEHFWGNYHKGRWIAGFQGRSTSGYQWVWLQIRQFDAKWTELDNSGAWKLLRPSWNSYSLGGVKMNPATSYVRWGINPWRSNTDSVEIDNAFVTVEQPRRLMRSRKPRIYRR